MQWEEGNRSGKGKEENPHTGEYYDGEFLLGDRCGTGTHRGVDGMVYVGDWKSGIRYVFMFSLCI